MTTGETLRNLENCLLNIFSFLKMDKFKNLLMTPDIIDSLRVLIKKEMTFIENFKRDKNNEKNSKFEEICSLSNNRLKMEIGILKKMGNNCMNNYEVKQDECVQLPLLSTFKEVEGIILDIFDKSSDLENLNDLLEYIKDCSGFIMDNEQKLNAAKVDTKKPGLLSVFQEKKFDNVKYDDSILEKLTNTLMNLLRKNLDNDKICENSKD
jgi:Fe-S cluster assembly ATPase SufC